MHNSIPERTRTRVWLEILEGTDEYDPWLWGEGDEKFVSSLKAVLKSGYTVPWHNAAEALRRRHSKEHPDTTLTRLVRFFSPEMRRTDVEVWDLADLITSWYNCQSELIQAWLQRQNAGKDCQGFFTAMKEDGHDCHLGQIDTTRSFGGKLQSWLYLRSIMNPQARYDVLHLGHFGGYTTDCGGCSGDLHRIGSGQPGALRLFWDMVMGIENHIASNSLQISLIPRRMGPPHLDSC
ncbi:hypothetical protein C8J56DRAFT_67886 [Mycena floridula]|nr:hypothetical protein C8J56DRAFT_67886 [Mycena floridula]